MRRCPPPRRAASERTALSLPVLSSSSASSSRGSIHRFQPALASKSAGCLRSGLYVLTMRATSCSSHTSTDSANASIFARSARGQHTRWRYAGTFRAEAKARDAREEKRADQTGDGPTPTHPPTHPHAHKPRTTAKRSPLSSVASRLLPRVWRLSGEVRSTPRARVQASCSDARC